MLGTGQQILELLRERDRIDAQIVSLLRQLDDDCEWADDGAVSLFGWLRDVGGRARRDAGRLNDLAAKLGRMPGVEQAWLSGELTSGQVEAVAANVDSSTAELFAEHEAELVPTLAGLGVVDCERAMRVWRAHAKAVVDGVEPAELCRSVHLSETTDGFVGTMSFDIDGGQYVRTALEVAESKDQEGEPRRTPAQRRADALVDICKEFLDHHTRPTTPRNRPHVSVIVRLEDAEAGGAGRYLDGLPADPAATAALVCDSTLRRIVMDAGSEVLDLGEPTKIIPRGLRDAVIARDHHCRFGQCDRSPRWCDVHHVVWISVGGHTAITNLVVLCRRHHRLLHTPGWHAKLLPDATFEVTTPEGLTRTSRPPGATTQLW